MEKGKGLARRWAVELPDASSSSPAVPDPPGFTRSAPDAVTPTPPRSSLRCFALCPAIHVPALDRRTTPLERASARTPRLHGRRRFDLSFGSLFVLGLVDPGRRQRDLQAMIG